MISAVASGQPGDAVMANIAAAARQCARTQDWIALVRLHEISRSADNLYAWRLASEHTIAVEYGRTFGSLRGVRALADRLLNDGKCTFQPGPGLLLCMACDAGGEIPPWPEYLEADELDDGSSGAGYGPEGKAEVGLARTTARMRLGGRSEAVSFCVNFLSDWRDGKLHPLSVAGELARMFGEEALGEVVTTLPAGMSRSWARFALAQIAQSDTSRKEQSELAIADGLPLEFWAACLRLGANPLAVSWDTGRLPALTASVVSEGVQFAPATLEEWITGLAIAQAKGDQNALLACSNSIEPDTWYHKWLLFCIVLARRGTTEQILEALRALSEDIRVFHGKPRACDLYSLEPSIHRSFGRALSALVDGDAIALAIRYLATITEGTTTWIQGTRSGPLTFDALLLLVLDSLSSASDGRITVIRALAEQFAAGVSGGEFYDTHATDCLLLCRLNVIAANGDRATEFWNKACTYLAAYGWHKDVTAYDVIDPIEALGRADPIRTRAVLKTAQPIVEGVLVHTDGKSTSGLQDRWLNLAAQIHPEGTLDYLARRAIRRMPASSLLHRFITKAAAAIDRSQTSELALAGGWLVAGMRAKTAFQTALLDLEAGIQSSLPTFISVWNVVIASMEGDNPESPAGFRRMVSESADRIHAFVPDLASEREAKPNNAQPSETFSSGRFRPTQVEGPLFLAGASIPEIVRTIRRLREKGSLNPDAIVNSLGWRLLTMAESNTESVSLTLRLVAPDLSAERQNPVLEDLAVGFERHGKTELAALAFALAYTNGRNEWMQFGGELDLFQRAEQLSSAIAWATLAEEVGDIVALGGSRSVSARVVEVLLAAGRLGAAFDAWEAACRAVALRLPRTGPEDDIEVSYCDDCQNRSEALAAVITSSLNSLLVQDKQMALAALALIAQHDSPLLAFCIRFAATNSSPPWTLTVLLQVLVEFERSPYRATSTLVKELQVAATDGLLIARMLARVLLQRAGLFSPSSPQIDNIARHALRHFENDQNRSPDDRIEVVDRILPGFGGRVQETMGRIRASKEMRRSMERVLSDRLRMQHLEHDLNAWYPFDEEYERVLQQTASDLIKDSAESERSDFEREVLVGTALLGDIELAVRSTLSRGTRPRYARLWDDVAADGFASDPVALEAGEFAGWVVASYLEVELVFGPEHEHEVKHRLLNVGGVVYDLAVDDLPDPVGSTDAAIWRSGYRSRPSPELRGRLGRLARFRGPFSEESILTPHPICLSAAMLSLASADAGLRFIDHRGRTAIVSRTWREQPRGEAEGDQIPKLRGYDLLMRPDVFRQVSARSPHAPRFVFRKGKTET